MTNSKANRVRGFFFGVICADGTRFGTHGADASDRAGAEKIVRASIDANAVDGEDHPGEGYRLVAEGR